MDTLTLTHWDMIDCLMDEIFLGKHDDILHGPEMLYELFRYFVSHDERFHAAGFRRNEKGHMEYTDREGNVFLAEGAIAAFLGLKTKRKGEASYYCLPLIYRPFSDMVEARAWLRWHVQALHGFKIYKRDLWREYPRNFPDISNYTNELAKKQEQKL